MAITTAAKRAIKVSSRKRVFNLKRSRAMKSIVKEIRKNVQKGEISKAKEDMPKAQKAIDKAAKRGIIKQNAASRKKSRLVALIKKHSS